MISDFGFNYLVQTHHSQTHSHECEFSAEIQAPPTRLLPIPLDVTTDTVNMYRLDSQPLGPFLFSNPALGEKHHHPSKAPCSLPQLHPHIMPRQFFLLTFLILSASLYCHHPGLKLLYLCPPSSVSPDNSSGQGHQGATVILDAMHVFSAHLAWVLSSMGLS